jgi:hypothetical protein
MANSENLNQKEQQEKIEMLKKQKELVEAEKALLDAQKALEEANKAPDAASKELKEKIAAAKTTKELVEAEKALLDAKKALDEANKAPDAAAKELKDKIAAAKAAKELADAEKTLAESKKSQADAQLAAFKASLGEVPQAPYTGSVELKDKVGQTEAALLAARAVAEAAAILGDRIEELKLTGNRVVLVFPSSDLPTFNNLISFRVQTAIVKKAFDDAMKASDEMVAKLPPLEAAVPPIAAVGTVLDSVNKLLGFFKTDYSVGGVDVTPDDMILAYETADALRTRMKDWEIKLPSVYNPAALTDSGSEVITKLTNLSLSKETAASRVKLHASKADEIAQKASAAATPEAKQHLEKEAGKHRQIAEDLKRSILVFDSYFGKLMTLDEKSTVPPVVPLVKEATIQNAMAVVNTSVMLVKIHKMGGGYFTKKNLWTVFLGLPLYFMGGAAITFGMLDGLSGKVLASGVIPVYGGFVLARKLRTKLLQNFPPAKQSPNFQTTPGGVTVEAGDEKVIG